MTSSLGCQLGILNLMYLNPIPDSIPTTNIQTKPNELLLLLPPLLQVAELD